MIAIISLWGSIKGERLDEFRNFFYSKEGSIVARKAEELDGIM